MLFELLLNGMDRFLKLRDTDMEMVLDAKIERDFAAKQGKINRLHPP